MGLEHRTDYCKNCKTNRKLERKRPNVIVHLLITIVLGTFTYGIGSIIWIGVWIFLSNKSKSWICMDCGHTNEEFTSANISHAKEQSDIITKLKESYKVIIGAVVTFVVIIVLFSLFTGGNNSTNDNKSSKKSKEKSIEKSKENTESKNNAVKARVDIQEKETEENKNSLNLKENDSTLCYLYNIKKSADAISGSVNCKEGKLTLELYDSDSKSVIDTKVVTYKEYKFYIKIDSPETKNLKFKITEKQKRKKEINNQNFSTVNYYNNKEDNKDKNTQNCTVQSWKYSKYSDEYLVVDGKTTCKKGKIILQIYDKNNNNLGTESEDIEFGVFSIFFKINSYPSSITIKYTISEE